MKTIGLLGGMSWYSTLEYYRAINHGIQVRLGGVHSAQCLLYSVDYGPIDVLERQNRWDDVLPLVMAGAQSLERGGADFVVICSNTTHKLADQIQLQIGIPILHIADAAGHAIRNAGLTAVGLLGTRFTMEEDYVKGRLIQNYGLKIVLPSPNEREIVNHVIYDELCAGQLLENSHTAYLNIIQGMVTAGAEGIILGCTEIGLLVHPGDCPVPLFDTAQIHAAAAVNYALT